MTPTEAAKLLEIPETAKPNQIEARFLELRTKLEEKIGKAPTQGLKTKYRESLDEITLAFETLTLAADSSALPVLKKEAGGGRSEAGGPESLRAAGEGGLAPPPRGPDSGFRSQVSGLPPPKKAKSGREFLIVALIAVVVLGAGGWFIIKTRAENAEQARLEAVAKAEAEAQAAQQAAAEKAEQERLARLEREQAEEARLAAEAEKQRQASLLAELLATQAEQKVRWQAIEQELSVVERKLSDLRADARNARDLSAPRQAALRAQLAAHESFVEWLRPWLLRHEARGTLARLEALLSARALDEAGQASVDLVAALVRAETELAEQRDRLLTLTGPVRLTSEPAGIAYTVTDAYGVTHEGRAPALLDLPLGEAKAVFQRPNWPALTRTGTVRAGDELTLQADMVGGTVVINSTPAGAEVRQGNQVLGRTPLRLTGVPEQATDYRLGLDGHVGVRVPASVRSRETTTLDVALEKVAFIALDNRGRVVVVSEQGTPGEPVSEETYDELGSNYEGLSWIGRNKKYGFVDLDGRLVTPLKWDGAGSFYQGRAKVKQGNKWGFIDETGRLVSGLQWDEAGNFSEGLAVVKRNGSRGFINRDGTLVIQTVWSGSGDFREGLAAVKSGDKWGFINRRGQFVIQPVWDWTGNFSEGLAHVQRKGKWGYVDQTGRVVFPPRWEDVHQFRDGIAAVKPRDKYGFIDRAGRQVIAAEWDGVYSSRNERVWCWTGQEPNRRFALFDHTGKMLAGPGWNLAYGFYQELVGVAQNGRHGFIDRSGRVVIPLEWDAIGIFRHGLAPVRRGSQESGLWGLIDRTGRVVQEPQFKKIVTIRTGENTGE